MSLDERVLNLLDFETFNELMALYLADTALPREHVAATLVGLPPMPYPPAGHPDGSGRLPAGINPAVARHPIFWFDRSVTTPRDHENETLWLARMWLELENAGLVDPDTGDLVDVLDRVGLDVEDPDVAERITRFAQGGPDPDLQNLVITRAAPPDGLDENWAFFAAAALVEDLNERWVRYMDSGSDDLANIVGNAVARIETPDFSLISGAFVNAGEQLRVAADSREVTDEVVAAFYTSVGTLLEGLRLAEEDNLIVEEFLGAGPTSDLNDAEITRRAAERAQLVSQWADACFETGEVVAHLSQIIRFANEQHQAIRAAGLRRVNEIAAADDGGGVDG